MKHELKWPRSFPSTDSLHAKVQVSVELVPADSAEPWRTVSFTTFAASWAVRLVDELASALSAPLLWVGWRDESREPPRTAEAPVVPSSLELAEIAEDANGNLIALMRAAKASSYHLTVGTGPRTFIVNLSFKTVYDESATETVDVVRTTEPRNRRIRNEF